MEVGGGRMLSAEELASSILPHLLLTLPFNVVAANSLASIEVDESCKIAPVTFHASAYASHQRGPWIMFVTHTDF